MKTEWKFDDTPDTACIATLDVVNNGATIANVYHDYEGGWQFLNERDEPFSADDACVVSLGSMIELDESLNLLHTLDYGWRAFREPGASAWTTEKDHPFPTYADSGYYLENTDWLAEYLDDVNPPPMEQRENLLANQWCKLVFRFREEMSNREDYDSERMWVQILEVDEQDYYTGSLLNAPEKNGGLELGAEVRFHPTHIMEIADNE